MRSPILPLRQAGRICDACKQQRTRTGASSSFSSYASSPARPLASARAPFAQRQHATDRTPRTRRFSSSPLLLQSPQPSPSPPEADTKADTDAEHKETPKEERPAAPRSHYDFFPKTLPQGPPPAGPFAIDLRALRREFLALQSGAHPDLHPSHLKRQAEAASSRINEAYRALESPLWRAQHVLALRGAADAAGDEAAKVEDPELLLLVLEAREAVEEARSEDELEALAAENEDRARASEDALERAFAEDDLEAAAREVVRLRYWVNIRECIRDWERGKPVVLQH